MSTMKGLIHQSLFIYKDKFSNIFVVSLLVALVLILRSNVKWVVDNDIIRVMIEFLLIAINLFFICMIICIVSNTTMGIKATLNFCAYRLKDILIGGLMLLALITFGFMLFILPGIYLYFKLFFVLILIVLEDEDGGGAIKKSFQQVKGNWWYIFLNYLRAVLLPLIVLFFINFMDFIFLDKIHAEIISIILSAIVLPYVIIVKYVIYRQVSKINNI